MAFQDTDMRQYYVQHEIVPFEEDTTHEFKGHQNISVEDIPAFALETPTSKKTRTPVSRTINGFLNSGAGGTAYLGIVDNGSVKGMNLSQYQRDHLRASVADLMCRYIPPVEQHRYSIRFVPVIDQSQAKKLATGEISLDSLELRHESRAHPSRLRDHLLRTSTYCWCKKDAVAQTNSGIYHREYVAEITIKPWDPSNTENKNPVGEMRAPPVHEDELGNVYIRRLSGNYHCTLNEVFEMSKQRAQRHYQEVLKRMKEDLNNG